MLVRVKLVPESLDWRHPFALDHALQLLGYQLKSPIPRRCDDVRGYTAYCSLQVVHDRQQLHEQISTRAANKFTTLLFSPTFKILIVSSRAKPVILIIGGFF